MSAGVTPELVDAVTGEKNPLGRVGVGGEEWQVIFKTRAARYPALEAHLLEHVARDTEGVCDVPIKR